MTRQAGNGPGSCGETKRAVRTTGRGLSKCSPTTNGVAPEDDGDGNNPAAAPVRLTPPNGTVEDVLTSLVRTVVRQELAYFFDATVKPILQCGTSKRLIDSDTLISTEVAATRVGVSAPTIRAWVKSGKMSGHRAGRLVRIKVSELELFLASGGAANVVDLDAETRRILGGGRRR